MHGYMPLEDYPTTY